MKKSKYIYPLLAFLAALLFSYSSSMAAAITEKHHVSNIPSVEQRVIIESSTTDKAFFEQQRLYYQGALEAQKFYFNKQIENLKDMIEANFKYELQSQKTYDSFLITLTVILTIFLIILALVAYIGYNNLNDLKKSVNSEIDKIKKEAAQDISEKASVLIEAIMEKNYGEILVKQEEEIDKLTSYLRELKDALERAPNNQTNLPNIEAVEYTPEEAGNTFGDDE